MTTTAEHTETSGTSDPSATSPVGPRAEIGVIGGSGLYDFLEHYETVEVETPFGPPSDPLVVGEVEGRMVAFIARHGKDHRFAPHRVNYRANLWALRASGCGRFCRRAPSGRCAPTTGPARSSCPTRSSTARGVGRRRSTRPRVRSSTSSFAEPYCPNGRQVAVDAARLSPLEVVGDGTLVVVNGPRFSSRAESLMHQQAGWHIVGMTTMPEAAIARELALCFTTIAMVTDLDAGVEGGEAVTHDEVLRVFADNVEHLKSVLRDAIGQLPAHEDDAEATCPCRRSLDGLELPITLP